MSHDHPPAGAQPASGQDNAQREAAELRHAMEATQRLLRGGFTAEAQAVVDDALRAWPKAAGA